MSTKVIMANDLISGDVIFLARDARSWTNFLSDAWIGESDQLVEVMLDKAKESHMIIGAESIDVEIEPSQGELKLKVFREQLRSLGPSVRTDLGKQALSSAA